MLDAHRTGRGRHLYGLWHLMSRATWDTDVVCDNIRGLVVERLRHGHAVLIVDEAGDLKKGADTVGVQPLGPGGHR
ncbi:transposase [Streptomyces hokutonensis]|uniref:transposase n=1 Tax=Streptomyces hokutonensis TaxID=1306990 RepID=UPI0036BFA131